MDLEIRIIDPEEFEAYVRSLETSFSGTITPEELETERLVAEYDRYHAAFEDRAIVGGAAAVTFAMTVPGGSSVQAAGVTAVGVMPSHRRRGVNTNLMRAQLDDVRARGESVAVLYASEGGIYGRFGYGMASFMGEFNLETTHASFVRGYRPTGKVRLLAHDEALPRMHPVYDAVVPTRPGMMAMDDRWYRWRFTELERHKEQPWFYALHETETGEPDAYAVYEVKQEWPDSMPRSELSVREMIGTTPQSYADMWRFLFDIDLIRTVKAWNRPVDESLLRLMAEPRQLRFSLKDALWVRLVDVAAALSSRGYAADGSVTFEVRDDFCPWNDGRYTLTADAGRGSCVAADGKPDIVCSVNALGATYLGGSTFRQLYRAGQVEARSDGALVRADAIFASDPAPWCSFLF